MTLTYCVAGHRFSFILRDDDPIALKLDPYKPFICEHSGSMLFELEVVSSLDETAVETVYDEEPEEGMAKISIGRCAQGWYLEMRPLADMKVAGKLVTDEDFRKGRLLITDRSQDTFAMNSAAMLLFAFASATLDTLEMHASVTRNSGRGYLFLGRSGTGKSTHSSLWLKYIEGSDLMNDDNPVIRVGQDGIAKVYGSPWSGKTPCYRNVSAPIGGIVSLKQAKYNRIEALPITAAYAVLYSSCSGFRPIKKIADGLHSTLEKIVSKVPCYCLECLPDEDAARVCAARIRKEGAE